MLRTTLAVFVAALATFAAPSAHAVGSLIDLQVVDRDSGETLTPVWARGSWWIAGRPGARYEVRLANRDARRTLSVLSIDGVNAISGDTAAWSQTGYVLDGYDRIEVAGWRKNLEQVAAFTFTALPDSYAARTGRPTDVGVIGVAVFTERTRPVRVPKTSDDVLRRALPPSPPSSSLPSLPSPSPAAESAPQSPARMAAPDASASLDTQASARVTDRATTKSSPPAAESRERLGTGHGEIETSIVRDVPFERAQSRPVEIVTLRYDRRENLIALGILPPPIAPVAVRPFPANDRFVADPPR